MSILLFYAILVIIYLLADRATPEEPTGKPYVSASTQTEGSPDTAPPAYTFDELYSHFART